MASTSKVDYWQVLNDRTGEVIWDHLTAQEAQDKCTVYSTPETPLVTKRIQRHR